MVFADVLEVDVLDLELDDGLVRVDLGDFAADAELGRLFGLFRLDGLALFLPFDLDGINLQKRNQVFRSLKGPSQITEGQY